VGFPWFSHGFLKFHTAKKNTSRSPFSPRLLFLRIIGCEDLCQGIKVRNAWQGNPANSWAFFKGDLSIDNIGI
jgi:hypothetical protein